MHKEYFGQGQDSNPCPSARQTSKTPQKSRSYVSVAVSGSQLIKLIKSVTSSVLKKRKKEKSLLQSAFFYEKRRLKKKSHYYSLTNNVQSVKHKCLLLLELTHSFCQNVT